MTNEAIKQKAIELIDTRKRAWENATTHITDKISFNMREVIKQCRKNYYGVFDVPKDEKTGRDKTFVPLTESIVETSVKNIDIDLKDLFFKSRKPENSYYSIPVREDIKKRLREMNFGELLDYSERMGAIDGTVVWKTIETEKDGKKTFEIKNIDLLNFYIDPTAESIEKTDIVFERSILTYDEFMKLEDWQNKESVGRDKNVNVNDQTIPADRGNAEFVTAYDLQGQIPKYLITGNDEDTESVTGHIGYSYVNGNWQVHLIEESDRVVYEEWRWTKVPGRWYGRGPVEKLLMIQLWLNMTVNIRITRATVSQLGLFKIKRNSNITPDMLSKLAVNGAIKVNNMDDIEQFVVQEAGATSYKDEETAQTWAERVTAAFEVVTGETLPSTTTATVGAIQSRSATSSFVFIKKGFGMFIERVFSRQVFPILKDTLKAGDIINMRLEGEELRNHDNSMIDGFLTNNDYSGIPEEQKMPIRDELSKVYSSFGDQRFLKLREDVNIEDYIPEVYVTEEDVDKNTMITDMINMMKIAPEYREQLMQSVVDILGIRLKPQSQAMLQQPMQGQIEAPVSQMGQLTSNLTQNYATA